MGAPRVDLEITRGVTFYQVYQMNQPNGSPVDLTTLTLKGQIRPNQYSDFYIDLNPSPLVAVSGSWQIGISASQTALIGFSTGYYNVVLLNSGQAGEVDEIMWGSVTVKPGITR